MLPGKIVYSKYHCDLVAKQRSNIKYDSANYIYK